MYLYSFSSLKINVELSVKIVDKQLKKCDNINDKIWGGYYEQ